VDKLTAHEWKSIDDAHGSAGVAGAELLLSLRSRPPVNRLVGALLEVNDAGPQRVAPDATLWLSVNGEGSGLTVAEWLALVPRPPGLDRAADSFAQPIPTGQSTVRPALSGFGPVFTAAYSSECPGCCADVEPGQPARMFDGGAWHADCADADLAGWSHGPDGWEP
jgi:hypothetical protein